MKIKLFITVVLLNCFVITNASNFENHKIITAKTISPITASNSGNTCISSSFNLFCSDAGSGYIYLWTGPNGFTSNQQNPIVTPPYAGSLMYTVTATNGITTETASTVIDVFFPFTPTFNPFAPICQGSPAPYFPFVSTEGFSGTWSPSTIDTNTIGTQIFTFTPDVDQCALSVVMNVEIVANPIVSQPSNTIVCGNNGYGIFNLTALNPQISIDQNVTFSYFPSLADAFANTNVILNPQFYTNTEQFIQTLGIRITNAAGCYNITTVDLTISNYPTPVITTQNDNNTICVDYITNQVVSPLLLEVSNLPPGNYTYEWFADGLALPNGINSTYLIEYPLSNSSVTIYDVVVKNDANCSISSGSFEVTQSGLASPVGIGYSIVNNAGNQTITVEVNGYGIYNYSLDSQPIQESPVFANVALGSHTISVYDTEGCGALLIENVEVSELPIPPPTGNSSQSFLEGATLADIIIEGENIQWYDSQNPNADKNTLENTLLPLTTVLVNGTTYFASQKIGGYESINRLPVTVTTTLNNSEFVTNDFYFSPNPVINNLAIKFKKNIKNITIYNTLGQLVLSENGDFLNETNLDLSYLNSGYYLVKLENETEKFTLKIVKK